MCRPPCGRKAPRSVLIAPMYIAVGPGEWVGIVGASGCGKSTLLRLIARLTHGHEGEILLNGRPIETVHRDALVEEVGYVGQKPLLFRGTVRENLTLGRPQIHEEDIILACKRANIHEDVIAMPKGGFSDDGRATLLFQLRTAAASALPHRSSSTFSSASPVARSSGRRRYCVAKLSLLWFTAAYVWIMPH